MDDVRYQALKNKLDVDTMLLTEELTQLPMLQQDASEAAAEAVRTRDECKDYVEVAKAAAAAGLRGQVDLRGKQPSETQIASELLLDTNVQNAVAALRDAEYETALWRSLADGMRTKSNSIRTIADLIQAGYTSPSSVYGQQPKPSLSRRR